MEKKMEIACQRRVVVLGPLAGSMFVRWLAGVKQALQPLHPVLSDIKGVR